jgi:hypothetical protein
MENGSASEHIRQEMAAAREALARDARAVASDARTLTDWRNHFRAHPWLFCGGAAALGFLLVPQKERLRFPQSVFQPAETNGKNHTQSTTHSTATWASTLLGVGATFLARQSANYIARRGLDWLGARAAQRGAAVHEESHYDQSL